MKIISWNVNGLRSAEKEFLELITTEQPDMMMLQEVRAHPNQLSFFLKLLPNYKVEFNHSDRAGYGGTAFYFKENLPLEQVSSVVGNKVLDVEGRTILCQLKNLSVLNFYVPNGNSGEERLRLKLDFCRHISGYVEGLLSRNQSVIIGGDFNVAHTKLDVYSPEEKGASSGFLEVERYWFSNLLLLGFVDTFRMFEKEGGHYTWWHLRDPTREKNIGWRYDYFLVSQDLSQKVKKSEIMRDFFGSDHCPIKLEVEFN